MLEAHRKPNQPKLVAVVAYYPSAIPSVHTKYPPGVKILVHLAGTEVGVVHAYWPEEYLREVSVIGAQTCGRRCDRSG